MNAFRQVCKATSKYIAGAFLALILLWWVLRQAGIEDLSRQLREASLTGLTVAALVVLLQLPFRVWRWRVLLQTAGRRLGFGSMSSALVLGYAVNISLPGRLGEVVRPTLLAARERLSVAMCLGSVLADRWLDSLAILVLFLVGILLSSLEGEAAEIASTLRTASFVMVLLICIPMLLIICLYSTRASVEKWLAGRQRVVSWIGRALLDLARGIESVSSPRSWAPLFLHTALIWISISAGTWIGIRSCGAQISYADSLVLLPLLVLGITIPTPAGAGGYHAGMTFGLIHLFGVSAAVAVSSGVLVHLCAVVPLLLLAAILLATGQTSVSDLLSTLKHARTRRPSEAVACRRPPEAPLRLRE